MCCLGFLWQLVTLKQHSQSPNSVKVVMKHGAGHQELIMDLVRLIECDNSEPSSVYCI